MQVENCPIWKHQKLVDIAKIPNNSQHSLGKKYDHWIELLKNLGNSSSTSRELQTIMMMMFAPNLLVGQKDEAQGEEEEEAEGRRKAGSRGNLTPGADAPVGSTRPGASDRHLSRYEQSKREQHELQNLNNGARNDVMKLGNDVI